MRPRGRGELDSLYFNYPQFPFVRPAELDGQQQNHPVAIVGAGPVGLTAALELARHGVPAVVLDDKNTLNDGSRAICISRHSFEILQQLGVADAFVAKGLGWTHGRSYYHDQQIFRLVMPHSDQERFYPMYNLQQQYTEQFLVDKAAADERIELRWQNKVRGIEIKDQGAILSVQTPQGDYRLHADYVLAADGARSVIRQSLGLALEGDAYEGRYMISDVRLQSDFPTERRAFFDPVSNPGSTVLIHRQPDDIWRIDWQLQANEDPEEAIQEHNLRPKIAAILEMVGETGPWELEWWSIYSAYTLCLDDYRHGPVLFIGDAAHLVPIFGVRGLNNGFADAVNAAWKLAYVISGRASDAILDSYTPERRGATLDVFKNARKSTWFMTPPTRGYRLMREAALSLALSNEFTRRFVDPRQVQPYTYSASALTSFPERDAEFAAGPAAGAAITNRKIARDDYLLDHLGCGFTGLYFCDAAQLPEHLLQLCRDLALVDQSFAIIIVATRPVHQQPHQVIEDAQRAIFAAYGAVDGSFYLLRPDRHVAARWRSLQPVEVQRALAMGLGEQK